MNRDHPLFKRYGIEPVYFSKDGKRMMPAVHRFVGLLDFCRNFVRTLKLVSPLRWFWCMVHGFTPATYRLYGLDRNDHREYLAPLREHRGSRAINGHFSAAINNKLLFAQIMERHAVPCPAVPAYIARGRVVRLDGLDSHYSSLEATLNDLLDRYGELIFKPVSAGGGKGIFFLGREGHDYAINHKVAPLRDLLSLVGDLHHYVIVQVVQQADYAWRIFPGSTNTLRILTLWDDERDEPFVAAAAHRFGTSKSGRLDNFHGGLGGYSTRIDLETGGMDPAYALAEDGELVRHEVHRDTNEPIAGVVVPRWSETRDQLLAAAARFAYADCIGWDIVMTEAGWTCIETNSPPRSLVWQVHTPLLEDPRSRRFYEKHYGVKPRPAP